MGCANGLPSWPLVINHINDALITDIDADHGGSRQGSVVASFVPNQMEGRRFFVATRRQEKSHTNSERNSELRNKGRHFRALPSDEAARTRQNMKQNSHSDANRKMKCSDYRQSLPTGDAIGH